jgi:hypothetical protein
MLRRTFLGAAVTAIVALAFGAASLSAAPVRLARHPDYHAGKVTFSYLGDIWTANEDGTACTADRQRRARGLPAVLARRQVDRLLLEPLRQLRRLRGRRPPAARRSG